ncbi:MULTISPECIES: hypothetical protein [unclassified Cryobacterium]|uniref:hypothetical protein n=1 Tax=unclassified Cryobacterium TaxID=2649013 RepID=UPI002AB4700D|nr:MULTISPECIES: hypothetical protein [unclassified Cryobacterium]MDY7542179.1 hypothetical protein [Cryobacterium sp. 5B3]MEB0267712.1 hypothetical protein [Cryobacterium sp. 10I5]MEB0276681.1 hypothetical protein [Cryobacterium sp. 5B3]
MNPDHLDAWRPLKLSRDATLVGLDGRSLNREVAVGRSVRLRRGVFVDAGGWDEVNDRDRHFLRMRAVASTRLTDPVFSHQSAAAIWGLPVIGPWPDAVHLMAAGRRGVHSKNGVVWHHDRLGDSEVVEIDGMLVTSLLRTLIDLARTAHFLSAIAALDHGTKQHLVLPNGTRTPGIEKDALLGRLENDGPLRGTRAARVAILFSDNRSGSVGESLSRGQIHLCGFPAPELQVRFVHADGTVDITDYRWEQKQGARTLFLLGEFDGYVKYTRNQYTQGRPIEEIVWDEKRREDRLRQTTGHGMTRWVWKMALVAAVLQRHLMEAGLRPERRVPPLGQPSVARRAENRR